MSSDFTNTFLHDYVNFVSKSSEASRFAHTWAALTCTAAYIGRSVYLPFGMHNLYPNLYTLFVGTSGSRKSAAIKSAQELIRSLGYDRFAPTVASKVGLFADLAKSTGTESSGLYDFSTQCFVCADEISIFLGINNVDFAMSLGQLWDISGDFEYRTNSAGKIKLTDPYFSILGGITPKGFVATFPQSMAEQGFLTRLILVHVPPPPVKFHLPPVPDALAYKKLGQDLNLIKKFAAETSAVTYTDAASKFLERIYTSYVPTLDTRFDGYVTRRYTHLLKITILCTILQGKKVIDVESIIFANTLLGYSELCMPDVMGVLSSAKDSDGIAAIFNALTQTNKPLSARALFKEVYSVIIETKKFADALSSLQQAGKIKSIGEGEHAGYVLVRRAKKFNSTQRAYINPAYLKGLIDDADYQSLLAT